MHHLHLISISLNLLSVLVLVILNGFFVAAEFALVKIRETQLDTLADQGHQRARIARHILGNLNAYLSATQLGVTMASLGLGWIGEPIFAALFSPVLNLSGIHSPRVVHSTSFILGFSVLTFLHICLGELIPKWTAIRKPLPIALWTARPLQWFYLASYPFNWALHRSTQFILRQLGLDFGGESERAHSDEELRLVVSASQKRAGASALGREVVLNALDLRHRIVREVMQPRTSITFLRTDATIAECLEVAEKTRYSRFPLCDEGDLDKTLGVIHIKDLYAMRLKARTGADLLAASRKLIYVPETARLERLLKLFLDRRLHLAIVVDEYGGTMGTVTLENILEELVGQIQDEFDQEKPLLSRRSENEWEVAGALPLHDLEEVTGPLPQEEGVTTASGWVTQRLGGFPKTGDSVTAGTFKLQVEELDGMKVARLRLTRNAE
jgi:CBS domain containing-hemolysin-like protein